MQRWLQRQGTVLRMQQSDFLLHRTFERQVALSPAAVAIIDDHGTMSFAALNQAANGLAHSLVEADLAGRTIGICLDRSRMEIVAVLAVLKAGGAYLPLDPDYPTARLAYMAEDSGVKHALVGAGLEQRLPAGVAPISLDANSFMQRDDAPVVMVDPDDACFVIYTSGSTGRPKGVRSPHRSTAVMMHWLHRDHPFASGERFSHRTTLNFIVSVWEIFGPLLAGSPLVIAPPAVGGDAAALVRHLAQSQASRVVVVPTLVRAMVETMEATGQILPALRRWISVGEPFPRDLALRWRAVAPQALLLNLYGCSEAHSAACHVLAGEPGPVPFIPIGRELPGRRVHVTDANRQPLGEGEEGEIWIAGDGLSTGYINQPELTAERFGPIPELGVALAYRTGDRGMRLANGEFIMLGRADRQVKIRGHRVELQEIEATLRGHPAVSHAAVTVREIGGEPELAAYVVVRDDAMTRSELREHLRNQLPAAMVPAAIAILPVLPTNPNGKLDLMALPDPERTRMLDTTVAAPETEIERGICEIWSSVLAIEPIGCEDGFFDLGGYSNKAATTILALRNQFGVELTLERFFALQTPRALALEIATAQAIAGLAAGQPESNSNNVSGIIG